MKTVLTLPEAERVLRKATQHLSFRSNTLVEKLTLTSQKRCMLRECLSESNPGDCFTLEKMLNLTKHERDVAYDAINHVLRTKALQIAFANEYDDAGGKYPMMFLNVDMETFLG